jgi:hypothetical protein
LQVSILTRPEGRVQLRDELREFRTIGVFQSSPVPKDGCNDMRALGASSLAQVSILTRPEGRVQQCREALLGLPLFFVSILTRPEGRVQRQARRSSGGGLDCFNPHPSRRTGATSRAGQFIVDTPEVSILTRPEGRVQPARLGRADFVAPVSILTRPEGRVQHAARRGRPRLVAARFNPHPSRRTGAT